MTAMDEIKLTGLRASAFHGVLEHERANGQLFLLDVTVRLPLERAGRSDDLGDTIHYGELAEQIVGAVQSDPVDLIETVAERVADVVLAHPLAHSVVVTVHKPNAPIAVPFDDVSVTIERTRK
jgi:7,8-dihydroneopterin aldolase/epimerase/oxygenase